MSNWQATLESTERDVFGTSYEGSSLSLLVVLGLGLLALGVALFGQAIFHAFENGTCSTTGYTAHYGPVPHCAKGIGWWMLMLLAGIVVAGAGAAMSGTLSSLMAPVLFLAIGAPFLAIALRGGDSHLLVGASSSTGNLSAGIFGACFVVGGLVWGALTGRRALARINGASRVGGLVAAVAAVAAAFVIAASVAGAVGSSAPTALQQSSPVITQGSGFGGQSGAAGQANSVTGQTNPAIARGNAAAARKANAAVKQATAQAQKLTKLAACVSAAGANTARIQGCEAKYTP
jgi:hypothetical protein